ncbi:MAG: prepilin-type N-terminal cleavage/methylation domain-containing protein, partial [Candidatus Riflebacteria bacterium]|nr:prepilin-type N-terminal cleavage/methylation domain-containing protein [Candidatus Riflebacteria bacterium]
MRNRKGFTLMELLLVVAVLAIVAAAAAPTFFSGASEAMNEARKSSFMAAYTNASSAANMNAALYATGAKGDVVTAPSIAELMENSPVDTRIFTDNDGNFGLIYAEYDSDSKSIEVKYTAPGKDRPTAATVPTGGVAITVVSDAW